MFYLVYIVCDPRERNQAENWYYPMEIVYGVINLGVCVYMIYIEVKQIKRERSGYFKQALNYFDLFQFIANIFIILVTMFEIDYFSK